jgi:hypothetical protein
MTTCSKPEVEAFAGIDVSAREISVARLRSKEENPKFATFANSPSRHKALLAFLLEGADRVRVCLEPSGNYSLDLALALHAHRQVEISVINPRRASRRCPSTLPLCRAHALGGVAAPEFARSALARHHPCN